MAHKRPQITMSYLFFTSYSRTNAKHPPDAELIRTFVDDLSAEVLNLMQPPPVGSIAFFDTSDIETGAVWKDELAEALQSSRLAVALYSPAYFSSQWCGKEFRVFLDRRAAWQSSNPNSPLIPHAVLPVLWITGATLPSCAEALQYADDTLPREYRELGLRQLMRLKGFGDLYNQTVTALATRIVKGINASRLPALESLDLSVAVSAWDQTVAADPDSHTTGAISKTCFVFVAQQGWHWRPYPDTNEKIGAIAQQVSGTLGLQYEEIACDPGMTSKLKQTNQNNVPTVIFGDPNSMPVGRIANVMREYDTLYLLNCGMLVPWMSEPSSSDASQRWSEIRQNVCPQKTSNPPPHHEWRSIFSLEELKTKTLGTIENIRLRLLQNILSDDSNAPVRKAEDQNLVDSAIEKGIRIDTAPQLATTLSGT